MPSFLTFMICLAMLGAVFSGASSPPAFAKDKELTEEQKERRMTMALNNLGTRNYIILEQSIYYLERQGEEAIPHLIKILREKDEDDYAQMNAIYTLGRMGKVSRRAVPLITTYLRHEEVDAQGVAVIALGKIGKDAAQSVSQISRLLLSSDQWLKKSAVQALERIGTTEAKDMLARFEEMQDE